MAVMGRLLVSAGIGRVLKVWDPATWTPLAICDSGALVTAIVAWDDTLVVAGRADGQVQLWPRDDWRPRPLLSPSDVPGAGFAAGAGRSRDGDGDRDGDDSYPHQKRVTAIVRVDEWLVTASMDSSIKVWSRPDVATDSPVTLLHSIRPFAPILGLAVTRGLSNRPQLLSTDSRGKTKRWQPGVWTLQETLASRVRFATSTTAYDDLVVNGMSDGTFVVLTTTPFQTQLAEVAHGKGNVAACFVTEDTLVTASDDFTVRIHDSTSLTLRTIIKDDIVRLRRMLVLRRTMNLARATALLTALLEFAELSKWRNLSFVEHFVAHRVYPTPAALRVRRPLRERPHPHALHLLLPPFPPSSSTAAATCVGRLPVVGQRCVLGRGQ